MWYIIRGLYLINSYQTQTLQQRTACEAQEHCTKSNACQEQRSAKRSLQLLLPCSAPRLPQGALIQGLTWSLCSCCSADSLEAASSGVM